MTTESKYWEGVPDELKSLILADCRGCPGCGEYHSSKPIIDYLTAHMNDCDSIRYGVTPFDVLRWIDIGIEALFPLAFHAEDWVNCHDEILAILTHAEELLEKHAPGDYKSGFRRPEDCERKTDIIGFSQKLNVYYCALFSFTEEAKLLQERLECALFDTSINVFNLLKHEDAEKLATEDDWAELHYPGTDAWEPLTWLARESLPSKTARREIVKYFEKYAIDLYTWRSYQSPSKACAHLHNKAEKRLIELCKEIIEEIEEEEEDMEEENGFWSSLQMEKVGYEMMIKKSLDRQVHEVRMEDNNLDPSFRKSNKEHISFHEKYGPFTQKLRRLMAQVQCFNIPVVPLQCGIGDADIDCQVVDILTKLEDFKNGSLPFAMFEIRHLRNQAWCSRSLKMMMESFRFSQNY